MISTSSKEFPRMAYPKTLLSIVASAGGLAVFLIIASSLLISQPIGSTVSSYFYGVDGVDHTEKVDLVRVNETPIIESSNAHGHENGDVVGAFSSNLIPRNNSDSGDSARNSQGGDELSKDRNEFSDIRQRGGGKGVNETSSGLVMEMGSEDSTNVKQEDEGVNVSRNAENVSTNKQKSKIAGASSADSGCDLYHGKWVYDSTGPLYTNNSCPVLTQMQNCQGNGRPDKEYENWQWKPAQCDLPRFDAKKFLELMRGKTLAFVGDSVARNQMESLLCILWQVEVPKNHGNRKMQRYFFRSTSTMIVRIWSSWLIHQSSEPFDFAPAGVDKLHLDSPDERFMEFISNFDVIVLSSGHWFAKRSVYILNNEIVGGQLWWPDKSKQIKINNIEAFGISVETIVTAMAKHPNYTGLTILRSFSPDHYEGGAWNTGGSCTGKEKPAVDTELVENGFTNIMHEKQVTGFNRAIKKQTNKSKAILMDITKAFSYRHDGHPGPYRSPDPNKITKRGPDGRPPPQDCLHWCMPGPVDTWNELVFEIIRREFEARQNNPS